LIPAGQKFLLVMYGQGYAQTRHDFGLTITVARQQSKTVSKLSFLTAVHTANGMVLQCREELNSHAGLIQDIEQRVRNIKIDVE
jgi:hypothetical protein